MADTAPGLVQQGQGPDMLQGPSRSTVQDLLHRAVLGQPGAYLLFVVLAFLARGEAVTSPLWSVDGYAVAQLSEPAYEHFLSQGRYGSAMVNAILDTLGLYGPDVTVAGMAASILLYVHAGLLFAHVVFRRPTSVEASVFLTLFVLHPFFSEMVYFSEATLHHTLAFWFAASGLYLASRPGLGRWTTLVGACALLVLATSMYQTATAYAVVVVLLALGVDVARLDGSGGQRRFQSRAFRVTSVVIASVPVYLVSARLVSAINGVSTDARVSFTGLVTDWRLAIEDAANAIEHALWPWEVMVPTAATAILLLLLGLCIGLVVVRGLRIGRAVGAIACALLMIAALFAAAAIPTAPDGAAPPVPRVLVAFAVAAAGVAMMGWRSTSIRPARAVLTVFLVILAVSYIGASNRILADQRRVNRWDTQLAARIVSRLESDPAFADARTVVMIPTTFPYNAGIGTWVGHLNIPAGMVGWAQTGLVEQTSGYWFEQPNEADWARAREYCDSARSWPAIESTAILGSVAVVCLP